PIKHVLSRAVLEGSSIRIPSREHRLPTRPTSGTHEARLIGYLSRGVKWACVMQAARCRAVRFLPCVGSQPAHATAGWTRHRSSRASRTHNRNWHESAVGRSENLLDRKV